MTAFTVILLILLPLYLWPLRGGRGGLPGASALSGPPRDPRDPAAIAAIPGDVWDDLMGRTPPPGEPGNLTMITALEEIPEPGLVGLGDFEFVRPGPVGSLSLGPLTSSLVDAGSGSPGGESRVEDSSSSSSGPLVAGPAASGLSGGGSGWGGYPGLPALGPWPGGGRGSDGPGGGGAPLIWSETADPPEPTPEPATIVLIGTNVMLFGAAACRRWRRGKRRA